ncbi:hypothetical protein NVP2095A_72 [Vibrio phage 2.095.A._10N.286.46.E10]|nr:hypothetical protein NVP2095A_72 [Vibrio phage 2.095.A._10N.286.46.E10]AUS02230.1 hypothetical protein NVP2095B_72 [Vibrio phage 2.095.B._10N.286.46.E10]
MESKLGRPFALSAYTQEEVRQKVVELGRLNLAAKFYGVANSTVSLKIGNFHWKGVDPKHIKDIRAMKDTHTKAMIAEILGYTKSQIDHAGRSNGIVFASARKPRMNTELTHYEMNNMDLIVRQYQSEKECAKAHGVEVRTIRRHVLLCKQNKGGEQ